MTVHVRLITTLALIEKAIEEKMPTSHVTSWNKIRSINYHQGVARLSFVNKDAAKESQSIGSIVLKSYDLAGNNTCLKAHLNWENKPEAQIITLYPKDQPNLNLGTEQIALAWIGGVTELN
jgi:hypothetical protein